MNELTFVQGAFPEGAGRAESGSRRTQPEQQKGRSSMLGQAEGPAFPAASLSRLPAWPHERARSPASSRLLTSPPGTPARGLTRIPPAAAEVSGSSSSSFQPAPPGVLPEAGRFLAGADSVPVSSRKPRLRPGVERWEQMEAPEKQHLCRLTAPPAPSPPLGSGQGGRGARGSGARGEPGARGRGARGAGPPRPHSPPRRVPGGGPREPARRGARRTRRKGKAGALRLPPLGHFLLRSRTGEVSASQWFAPPPPGRGVRGG